MAQAARTADAPSETETLNLLIQNVRARMAEVKEARNDASDLRAAAEAVNALVEHVEPEADPNPETKAEEGQAGRRAPGSGRRRPHSRHSSPHQPVRTPAGSDGSRQRRGAWAPPTGRRLTGTGYSRPSRTASGRARCATARPSSACWPARCAARWSRPRRNTGWRWPRRPPT